MGKVIVVGDLEVGGERGRVIFPTSIASSLTSTDYKDPQKTVKKVLTCRSNIITMPGRAEQSRAEQSRAEQSRTEAA